MQKITIACSVRTPGLFYFVITLNFMTLKFVPLAPASVRGCSSRSWYFGILYTVILNILIFFYFFCIRNTMVVWVLEHRICVYFSNTITMHSFMWKKNQHLIIKMLFFKMWTNLM